MSEQDSLDTIRDFFSQGGTVQTLIDLDPTDLDSVYAYACQLFDAGEYAAAKRFYLLLARLSHWQFEYWVALGLCCQRLFEHDQALFCFGQAGLLRLDDPSPPYLAGLSYCLISNYEMANTAFTTALKWCSAKQEYAALKAEILRQQALLTGKINT